MANEAFTDLQMQHALDLLKFGNGVDREVQALLKELEKDVVAALAARLALIDERGFDLGPATTARLQQTIVEIRQLVEPIYGQTREVLEARLIDLASAEIEYTAKALTKAGVQTNTNAVLASPTRLRSIVTERPLDGKLLAPFIQNAADGTAGRIEEQLRLGIAQGETIDAMVRRIRGTRAAGFKDGVFETSRRSARAIVRTAVTHVSNHSQMEMFAANADLILAWEFLATLDSRTTIICASNDGKRFPVGEGPLPPLHPNCRSTITAVTDLDDDEGGQRASVDGPVANSNFENWLRKQSNDRQNEILGATRGDLWRDGEFDLSDFVRNNREVISLDELRARQPS